MKNEKDSMREEYNFSQGVRGKHYKDYRQGHVVRVRQQDGKSVSHYFTPEDGSVMLDPDVKKYFSTEESVNKALRSLIPH